MSKLVREIIGAVMIIAGVITGNPFLILNGAMMLGSALLTPSLKQQDRQAQATSLQLGEVPRSGIFGDAVTAGSLLDAFNYGGQYGTDWEALPIGLADHRCAALVGFYVNDVFVSYSGTPGTPWTVPGYNGQLVVTFHDGRADQTADPTMTGHGGWATTDTLAGVAYVVVAYKADDAKATNPVWSGGRPRFKFRVQGKLCYDPRKDSTVPGGSGSHRWATPSTWEFSDNVAICRYNWVRGVYACDRVTQPEQLLVGRGLSDAEAPPENVAWRANICDEAVALAAGGTEKRYRCGVIVSADETFLNTEEMWAAACGGVIRQPQGSVEVDPGHAITPTFNITDADLVTGEKVTFNRMRSDSDNLWVNTVIPRYVEPTQGWADHAAPIRRVYADVIADGGPREATQSLVAVTSGTQAQRCGEITRRLGRLRRYGGIVLGPRFAGVEDGDWGIWTSTRHTRGAPMLVRVESCALDEKWRNTLSIREVATSAFNWTTADEIAPGSVASVNTEPTFGAAPGASAWSVTGGSVTDTDGVGVAALIVTGAIDDAFADAIIIEYRKNGTTTWQADAKLDPATTRRVIPGVAPNTDYQVAISYQVRGVVGARRVLGPVTAGSMAAGPAGYSTATVKLYKRAATPPAVPSVTLTYTFATAVLAGGSLSGWTQTPQAADGNPQYVTVAPAVSNTATDTIGAGEWASPVIENQDGGTGTAGTNTATVYLFKRSASAPAVPTATLTYTFATALLSGGSLAGWTQTAPVHDGNPLYFITAAALSNTPSDTIATGEWATPQIQALDGVDGTSPYQFDLSKQSVDFQLTTGGVMKSGQLPNYILPALVRGTTDVVGSATFDFSISDSTNINVSYSGGYIQITKADVAGSIDVTPKIGGVAVAAAKRIVITRTPDPTPPAGQNSGSRQETMAIQYADTSLGAQVSSTLAVAANGSGVIYFSYYFLYTGTNFSSSNPDSHMAASCKLQYRLSGAGGWSDATAESAGSDAIVPGNISGSDFAQGEWFGDGSVIGLTAGSAYEFRLIGRRNTTWSGTGTSKQVAGPLSMFISQTAP